MTALYGQIGNSKHVVWHTGDTLTCYYTSELRKIADKIVYANECDTLLQITEEQLDNMKVINMVLNEALDAKDSALVKKDVIIDLKEEIIEGKDLEIVGLRDAMKRENRKLRWTRIGWISTTAVLTYLILSK